MRIFAWRCFAQAIFNLSIHIAPTQILDIGLHLQRDLQAPLGELFPLPMPLPLLIRASLAPRPVARTTMFHCW